MRWMTWRVMFVNAYPRSLCGLLGIVRRSFSRVIHQPSSGCRSSSIPGGQGLTLVH